MLLNKETIHLYRIDKTRGFGLWIVNGEVTRFVCTTFSALIFLSGDKGVSYPPGTRRVLFI